MSDLFDRWLISPFLATDAKDVLGTEMVSVVTIGAGVETGSTSGTDPMNISEEIHIITEIILG